MQPKRILTVAGTRPEAIKLAPLVRLLTCRPGVEHRFLSTGQHGALFHAALAPFGVEADADLALPNNSPDAFAEEVAGALPSVIEAFAPDLVLVQGDTSSAWATALAAAACAVPIGHVEAGLRSGDPRTPWPEERNRIEIDKLSALLFAPSAGAAANLVGCEGHIHVTGNTGIDALMEVRGRAAAMLHEDYRRLVLVTCHRREAIPRLGDLAHALLSLAERPDIEILLPLHGNPAVGGPLRAMLEHHPRIRLEPPMDHAALVRLMDAAHLLLTDSGGLQEEAPALGLPTLVLRDLTERPEPVASGNARLVGLDPARILAEAARVLDDPRAHAAMARVSFPYGRGDAASRIAEAIFDWLGVSLPTLHAPARSYDYR